MTQYGYMCKICEVFFSPLSSVHFLAANNLPVKELYLKLVSFFADDIEEPVVKQ